MIGNILLFLGMAGLSVFMVNRLYVGLMRKEIMVKGVTYSRSDDPIPYWIVMIMALLGLTIGLGICLTGIAVLLS